MIERLLRDDLASFETNWWGENALSTLNGNNGHIGYLAHINSCSALTGQSAAIRVMTTCIAAFLTRWPASTGIEPSLFGDISRTDLYSGQRSSITSQYRPTDDWRRVLSGLFQPGSRKRAGISFDPVTGLIRRGLILPQERGFGPPRAVTAAWTIYYLNWVDRDWRRTGLRLLKTNFAVGGLPFGLASLREYPQRRSNRRRFRAGDFWAKYFGHRLYQLRVRGSARMPLSSRTSQTPPRLWAPPSALGVSATICLPRCRRSNCASR